MRNLFAVLPLAAIALFAAPQAQAQLYAGGYGGLGIAHDGVADNAGTPGILTQDLGFGFGAFVGGYVRPNVRAEGEISYRTNNLESFSGVLVGGEVNTLSFMGNAYYDFTVHSAVQPYVGAGLGLAEIDMTGLSNGSDSVAAGQLMLGAAVGLSPDVDLLFEYRLFGTLDPNIGALTFENVHSGVLAGIRAKF